MKEAVIMDCGCISHDGGYHHELCPVPECEGILVGKSMECDMCGHIRKD